MEYKTLSFKKIYRDGTEEYFQTEIPDNLAFVENELIPPGGIHDECKNYWTIVNEESIDEFFDDEILFETFQIGLTGLHIVELYNVKMLSEDIRIVSDKELLKENGIDELVLVTSHNGTGIVIYVDRVVDMLEPSLATLQSIQLRDEYYIDRPCRNLNTQHDMQIDDDYIGNKFNVDYYINEDARSIWNNALKIVMDSYKAEETQEECLIDFDGVMTKAELEDEVKRYLGTIDNK